jgi:hypothetical protein
MRILSVFAVLALLVAPAFAGECTEGGCLNGFSCDNCCPLAQQANAWRAAGTEALAVKSRVQADHAIVVVKNLGKIA